jgi:SAM-dependent methyltransferase
MPASVPMADAYIHGTSPPEQRRLALLNALTNAAFHDFLQVTGETAVLDVGSGLGLLAAQLTAAAPAVRVVGVERSPVQVSAAARAPRLAYVLGTADRLPFDAGRFDLVYARYLLEHVTDPQAVLAEMGRVTRPGGRVAVCENDVSLFRVDPPCPAFDRVWTAFQAYQERLGGDSRIGRRLYRLFRDAGFARVELSVQPEVHWSGSPGFSSWITNIIGNVESAREGLVRERFCDRVLVDAAVAELAALQGNGAASSVFVWNRAMAWR